MRGVIEESQMDVVAARRNGKHSDVGRSGRRSQHEPFGS